MNHNLYHWISKNSLLIILLLAFCIRLGWGFYSYNKNVMEHYVDDKLYIEIASSILDKGLLHYQDNESLAYLIISPGLPIILSITKSIFGNNWMVIFTINSILSTLMVLIIYKISCQLFRRKIALFTAVWASIYVLYIGFVPTAGKEIWMGFLFLAVFCNFLLAFYYRKGIKYFILFTLFFILLVFIDERYLAYFPFYLVFLIIFEFRFKNPIKSLLNPGIFLLVFVASMSLWIYRSYNITGEILILTPRTAHVTSKILGKKSRYSDYMPSFTESRWYIPTSTIDSMLSGFKGLTDNHGRKIPDEMYQAVREGVLPHSFSYGENVVSCFFSLWKPIDISYGYTTGGYRFDGKWPLRTNLSVGLTYGILLLFSFWGWFLLFRQNRTIALLFLAIVLYQTFIHIYFIPFTRSRYRNPIDFIIIILGSYGMWKSFFYSILKILFHAKLFKRRSQ